MPQLTSAARYQGRPPRSRRCAYHANVMNTFEKMSSRAAWAMTSVLIVPPGAELCIDGAADARHHLGNRGDVGIGGAEVDDAGAEQEAIVEHCVGDEHLAAELEPVEQRLVERVEIVFGFGPGGAEVARHV